MKENFQRAHILAGQMTLTTRDLRDAQLYQVSSNKANHILAHRKNEGSTIQSATCTLNDGSFIQSCGFVLPVTLGDVPRVTGRTKPQL